MLLLLVCDHHPLKSMLDAYTITPSCSMGSALLPKDLRGSWGPQEECEGLRLHLQVSFGVC